MSLKPSDRPELFMLQNNITKTHEEFMHLALIQAKLAAEMQEVPIGAVLVDTVTNDVVASTYNQTILQRDPTAHAEILAIRTGCKLLGAQRIPECDLYVTLEPCPMCTAAISFARIRHVYFGATDEKSGGFVSGPALCNHAVLHHKPQFTGGIFADESAALLREFFKARR
jgi:tRNA(adenine34) deaminase